MTSTQKYTLKTPSDNKFTVNYQQELNPEQLEVVMSGNGPILVIAGAGSGKTRTITYRVARLIESGVHPSKILLVTFTNKAAKEMLHRVELLISVNIRKLWGGTFHHIANRTLRRQAHLLEYDNNFTILDQQDSKELLNTCITDLGFKTKERRFPQGDVLRDIISLSANTQNKVDAIVAERYPFFYELTDEIIKVALHYQKRKRKGSMMDFDDLLLNWLTLLSDHPTLREYYSHKFQYILVDEYQDTNRIQSDIVDLLSQEHKNTMVVGDDSQSIYYRSVPEILNLANASIINNQNQFQKHLRAIRESGLQPILVPFNDVMQQASFVAQRILELRDEGRSLNEMAVLYRAHYHSMELQMELTRRGIPFEVRSGLRFFEQAHIKDITGYLKVIVNPYDELAWKRIAKLLPKIGNATAHKIWNILSSSNRPLKSMKSESTLKLIPKPSKDRWNKLTTTLNHLDAPDLLKSPAEMIRTVLNEEYGEYLRSAYPDHESRMEDINQLMYFSQQYSSTESFLSELALLSSVTSEDVVGGGYEDERVKLSTIHQAKGLEWDIVFIIWLVEGRFPSMRSLNSSAGEEEERRLFYVAEERRLFYVAVTRARDELYLGYPLWDYGSYKSSTLLKPSRFIQEIPTTSYTKWMVEEEE
ncbi:MAG: ATP-dependent helicase [Deltaproteobacteria bacterium]|nr:ATP-dependent helicase [Deltaproteobacteria bacterium]